MTEATATPPLNPVSADAASAAPIPPVESAAPVADAIPAPTIVGAAPAAPPTETPAEATAEAKKPETLLGADPKVQKDEAPKPEGDKPADTPVEQKKEEGDQSAEPAPLPTYEKFTLPEEISLDDAKLGEFTKDLGEFERDAGVDHAKAQAFGQKLMDRYVAEVQANNNRLVEYFTNTWEKQKSDWKTAFETDPEIGGNRKDTTVNAALEFIRTHGGDDNQQQEFRNLMETTGIGNHPSMIRLLANANSALREGKPLPATKPVPAAQSKVVKRYGTS